MLKNIYYIISIYNIDQLDLRHRLNIHNYFANLNLLTKNYYRTV